MPWTAQGSKNEVYVPNEPAVGTPWGEQGTESEVYVPSESTAEPWGEQNPKNEAFVSSELAVEAWGEQGSRNEAYVKNERFALEALIYSNNGEQIYALDGSHVLRLFVVESPWIVQVVEGEVWV